MRILLPGFALMLGTAASGQMSIEQQQAVILKRQIERLHLSPRAVDDSFSNGVYRRILNSLDPMHLVFTQDDINRLSTFRYKLDDELAGNGWGFLEQLIPTYKSAVRRTDSIVTAILQKPLDFTIDEKVTFSKDRPEKYAANATELRNGWTRYFKLQVLNGAYDASLAQTPRQPLKDALVKNETAIRQKIKKATLEGLDEFNDPKALRKFVKEFYLMAVAKTFDPHTEYFSPEGEDQFKMALSKTDETYGFMIDEAEGKIVILQLIPGGPAWRSGEVHRNDQLLQMSFDGKAPLDVTTMDGDEVAELLDATEAKSLTIKIRKGDGSIKNVTLAKEKIQSEGGGVKGYVLKGNRKIGYISLPDFYTSWEDGQGSSCAEDVAKEIVNRKKEGIEGLIIDVRYNGGGSMQESIEMIGIFINDGPVFAVRDKIKAVFQKDPHRGTIWDGPLAVLINGQSASASESLAGSLQDYNRAVIIGSPSFGKATMQRVFPMDTTASGDRPVNSLYGYVKITVGKLYRLNGTTAQLQGVQPDVRLPDAFDHAEAREKNYPFALPADTIKRNAYYKPLPSLPVGDLAAASAARVNGSEAFQAIKTGIQKMVTFVQNKNSAIPLKADAYEKWRMQNEALMKDGSSENEKPSTHFAVANHQYEDRRLQGNGYAAEINRYLQEMIQKDVYLEEAFRVIADLIQKTSIK